MSGLEIRTVGAVDDWGLLRWTSERGDPLPYEPPRADKPVQLPPSPFGIAYPVALQGVGRVYLWTNELTARTHSILLERALVDRYLKAASGLIKQYGRRGVPLEEPQQRVQQAQAFLSREQWLDALTESVLAAEQSVVRVAHARLQRMHGRSAFLWGVWAEDAETGQRALASLAPPLNLIHLTLGGSPEAWSLVLQQAQGKRIGVGAALAREAAPTTADSVRATMGIYRGQVRYWDVAVQVQRLPTNNDTLSHLRELCEAARAVDFGTLRLLHGVHSLFERQSAYPLLEACVEADVPFEAIHLEWRWYEGTLYELDLLLESYGELGKPIHLRLGFPPDRGYTRFSRVAPLEWVEGALLIALSKPYVVALQIPAQATEFSAGALEDEHPSVYWERVAALAAWNRRLQGD